MSEEMKKHIESLIKKADTGNDGAEAMRFTQAAVNTAQVMTLLNSLNLRDSIMGGTPNETR